MIEYNREFELIVSLSSHSQNEYEPRRAMATELRRIADLLEEGDTFAESGNMYHADYGSWKFTDPSDP